MINFNTNPKKYQHWTLEINGQIASLILNVNEKIFQKLPLEKYSGLNSAQTKALLID
tara:strand:- start:170 stop:340 length:171 start_codon:yes stop_codon:yes gene_type:complete